MQETELSRPVKRGDRDADVKRVQEWLCLRGFGVQIDGVFGPASQAAVKRFQVAQRLPADGVVGPDVFAALVAPMTSALARIEPGGRSLGELAVAYAEQHLAQSAREIGGDNRGPWVRLYMEGNEGRQWLWCAGFVSFVLKQAAQTLDVAPPLRRTFSCDVLAMSAKNLNIFLDGDRAATKAKLRPGCLFLVRRTRSDWRHVGFVRAMGDEAFDTLEGNTNDDGSRNGYEVAANTRAFEGRDFILIA